MRLLTQSVSGSKLPDQVLVRVGILVSLTLMVGQPAQAKPDKNVLVPVAMSLRVSCALENGPLVVVVNLCNKSNDPLIVSYDSDSDLQLKLPDNWRFRGRDEVIAGSHEGIGIITVKIPPNSVHHHIFALHRDCENFKPGQCKVHAKWSIAINVDGSTESSIRYQHELSGNIDINIQKSSNESVRNLASELLRRASRAKEDHEFAELTACLNDTSIPAFSPIAIELMQRSPSLSRDLLPWLFRTISTDEACELVCTVFASSLDTLAEPAIRHWRTYAGKHGLSERHHTQLRAISNLWVNLSLLLYFPEVHTDDARTHLLHRAARYKPVVTEKDILPLVQALNDDSYHKRQQATSELISLGERVTPILQKLLVKETRPEPENRLRLIIRSLDRLPINAVESEFISAARSMLPHSKNARLILEALSQNAPSAYVTRKTREVLQAVDKEAPPGKKD